MINDTELTLEELDRDGALLEGIDRTYGSSRSDFLRKAVVGGGALLAALALPPAALPAKKGDVTILNFALTFEHLQATFYTETEQAGTVRAMSPERARWARVLGAHERAHVRILKQVLGRAAVGKPTFNFGGATENQDRFTRTAVAMEDLTVALLTGVVPKFQDRALTAAGFTLLTTEARHAAWARRIVGARPVAAAFDEPKPVREVARVVDKTNFIVSRPQTGAKRRPRFTG